MLVYSNKRYTTRLFRQVVTKYKRYMGIFFYQILKTCWQKSDLSTAHEGSAVADVSGSGSLQSATM